MPSSAARSNVSGLWLSRMLTRSRSTRPSIFPRRRLTGGDGPKRSCALEIHPDQVQGLAVKGDGHAGAAENPHARLAEQFGNRILDARPGIVVAQTAVDAERRAQAAQSVYGGLLRIGVEGDEVAGEHDRLGSLRVGDGDVLADLPGGHERADVNVGELADAESLEGARQAWQANGLRRHLEVQPPVQQAVGSSHEGRAGDHGGGSFQKLPPRRRLDFRARPAPPGEQPAHAADDSSGDREQDHHQKSDQRAGGPPKKRRGQQRVAERQAHGRFGFAPDAEVKLVYEPGRPPEPPRTRPTGGARDRMRAAANE